MTTLVPAPHRGRRGVGRRLAGLAPSAVALVAVIVLHRLGTGPLALPQDRSLVGLDAWAAERDAPTVAVALLRLVALVAAYEVALATTVAAIGHLLRLPGLVRAADRWTIPALRSTTARVAALGLTASTALLPRLEVAPSPPVSAEGAPGTATFHRLDSASIPSPPGTATFRRTAAPDPTSVGTATLQLVSMAQIEAPDIPAPEPAPTPTPIPAATDRAEHLSPWIVVPGDHLWSIAERTLVEAGVTSPTEPEVERYWRLLVAANPGLADVDLVFAGQAIVRPPRP